MRLNYKKIFAGATAGLILALSVVLPASAHVSVKPSEVLAGSSQTFNISVPNEREDAYVAVKLLIPKGVTNVTPTAMPGWTITTNKSGSGEAAAVTAITWSEGSVPAEQRADFTFRAKSPAKAGELEWKAYQTYADGTVIAWDQKVHAEANDSDDDNATSGPFSVTDVVTRTADQVTSDTLADATDSAKSNANFALYMAIAALVINLGIIGYSVKKR